MFSLLDSIELFWGVGIGSIFGPIHFAFFVPAKSVGVAQATGIYFNFRIILFRVQAPDVGGEFVLPPFPILRICPCFVSIGPRSTSDIEKSIRTKGGMAQPVVVGSDAPWIGSFEPCFGFRRMAVGYFSSSKNRQFIGHKL